MCFENFILPHGDIGAREIVLRDRIDYSLISSEEQDYVRSILQKYNLSRDEQFAVLKTLAIFPELREKFQNGRYNFAVDRYSTSFHRLSFTDGTHSIQIFRGKKGCELHKMKRVLAFDWVPLEKSIGADIILLLFAHFTNNNGYYPAQILKIIQGHT